MDGVSLKTSNRILRPAILIFASALLLRITNVLFLKMYDPAFTHPFMDARWHVEWARSIAMGLWEPGPFFRAPLYPFLLGLLFKLFGFSWIVPRVAQAIIGSIGCVLIYRLGKILAGEKVGIASGVIAALYGPSIYFDGEFLIEAIFVPLTAASLFLLTDAMKSQKAEKRAWHKWAAAGFFAGLAAIARPNILSLAPGIFLWLALEVPTWKRRLSIFALWFGLFMIPVGAVTAYNAAQGGGFVPVASQGGVNFWIGNNPLSDGKTATTPAYLGPATLEGSMYRDSVDVSAQLEAERRLNRKLTAKQVSDYWFDEGVRFIKNNPAAWLNLTIRKVYFLVNGYELPSNRDVYEANKWSPILRALNWDKVIAFPFGLLFPLAVAGMIIAARNPKVDRSTHRLLIIYLAIYSAGVIAFFVTGRHRLPIVPALIPYAALAISSIRPGLDKCKSKKVGRPLKTICAVFAFTLFLALCNLNLFDVRKVQLREMHINMGAVLTEEKRYAEAIEEFQKALDEEPRLDRAQFNIAGAYLLMGDRNAALNAIGKTLRINPNLPDAYMLLGNVHFENGNYAEAEKAYLQALSIDPNNALTYYNLALLRRNAGDIEGYRRELLNANRADPDFAPANIDIAQKLIEEGRYEEARPFLKRAARIDPDDERVKALENILQGR